MKKSFKILIVSAILVLTLSITCFADTDTSFSSVFSAKGAISDVDFNFSFSRPDEENQFISLDTSSGGGSDVVYFNFMYGKSNGQVFEKGQYISFARCKMKLQ